MGEPFGHGLKMDLNLNYDSWEDLRNKLAAGNIHYFSYQFIEEDMKKIQTIEEELYELGFNQDDSSSELTCYEMEVYNECAAYEYTLFPYDYNKSDFRYDDQIDKENLFNAIQVLRDLDLPFQKIIVNPNCESRFTKNNTPCFLMGRNF